MWQSCIVLALADCGGAISTGERGRKVGFGAALQGGFGAYDGAHFVPGLPVPSKRQTSHLANRTGRRGSGLALGGAQVDQYDLLAAFRYEARARVRSVSLLSHSHFSRLLVLD